jgi:hypothetical protein
VRSFHVCRGEIRDRVVALASVTAIACYGGAPDATGTPPAATTAVISEPATETPSHSTADVIYPPSPLLDGDHVYLGVNLHWGEDSPAAYTSRTGLAPEVLVNFFSFPLTASDRAHLDDFLDEARNARAIPLITLEPHAGLAAVTPEVAANFAGLVARANAEGMPVVVRFAHEMNGSWYAWGQQPEEYVAAFRLVASEVHAHAPLTAMLWAPNYGGGYPFLGGAFNARTGTPAFTALDTNADGELGLTDDPYAPYYPGDDAVDWVGMSLYHWGNAYPWGENEIPEADAFLTQLTGTYRGLDGDHTAVPDFYATYAAAHNKPMAITETAALFDPAGAGSEVAIKAAWLEQVFSAETRTAFPALRMINWFEWRKTEPEVGGAVIDWRVSGSPDLAAEFAERARTWLAPR